jgi:hypothetical protein
MAALSIQVPYPVFYDRDGQPLDNGNIYIGVANLDPVTNPLQVYYDEALTITASQPLVTSGGYVYRNGTPTQLYVNAADFSITVNDNKDLFVYSFPEATGIGVGAASIEYDPPFTAALTSGYTVADKLSQTASVKDFGAVGDGVADDTVAIQAAINACIVSGDAVRSLYIPGGEYKITSTLLISGSGFKLFGDGDSSRLISYISNGTACLKIASPYDWWDIDGIMIEGDGLDETTYIAGTSNPINCIGFEAYQTGSGFITRYRIRNFHIRGCSTGAKIGGFIGQIENIFIDYCSLGLNGTLLNAVRIVARFENCRKSYQVTDSNGLHFDNLLDEGLAASVLSSTLDNCDGVIFTAPYWEWGATNLRANPYLTIGGTTECKQITITNGSCSSGDCDFGVYPIVLDRVNGADVRVMFSPGTRDTSLLTTSNTKNLIVWGGQNSNTQWLHDGSLQLGVAHNYFPNRSFDLWFRGWGAVTPVRATFSQETSIVRKGRYGVKILCDAGQSSNYLQWTLNGPSVEYLRGKSMQIGVWVWVPDLPAFDEQSPTALVGIVLQSSNGVTTTTSAAVNTSAKSNAWNFMVASLQIQSDATSIFIRMQPNQSGTLAAGTEYIVVDSIMLCESTTPYWRMLNDTLIDSPMIDSDASTGRAVIRASAAPTDADQTYVAGDQVWYPAPTAGGSPGLVCTTGGVGGVAVWKDMANLAA